MRTDWAAVTFLVCAAAVIITVIAAIVHYNLEEQRVRVRAGMCEVFKDPPRSWVWEKCR